MVKNPPAVEETWVWSLGWEDPLEEGIATHSSLLAWRITMAVEPGMLQTMESQRVIHYWATKHTLWGSATQREPKSGRKRTTAGDRTPSLVCMAMWSENESLSIMIKKQNGIRKRNRSGLFTPPSPEWELRSVFIWCQFMVHWSRWLQGWEGENLLLKSKLFSQICLRKETFFPLQIKWRSVSHSPHISGSPALPPFCPASSSFPPQLLWHHFPHYGQLHLSTLLYTQLLKSVFQDCHFDISKLSRKQVKCNICLQCLFSMRHTYILNSVATP